MITIEEVKAKTPERFWSKVKFGELDECWGWKASHFYNDYAQFGRKTKPTENGRWTMMGGHRFVYMELFGELPYDIKVCHSCDNPKCVNPNHLYAGTQKKNLEDMYARGRDNAPRPKGSKNPKSKLTEEDIPKIRAMIAAKVKIKHIAELFKIDSTIIYKIKWGKHWSHVI